MTVLKSKTIDRICCLALVVMLALTAVIWSGKAAAGRQKTLDVGYEGLFDQSAVHTIDIEISDWDSFIATATQEEYVECAVTIDGEKLSSVGIRAKGNTSLSSVATLGSEKYSFKIEFDHFVKGRLYKGLDKLSLNNLIYDATMMKDYLAYTLMGKMDVPSPLCSYVQITVNGEPWGLYLAVEGVEDGFMERNNMTTGELYKPDSMSFGGGRGNGRDFDIEDFREKEDETAEETQTSDQAPAETASPDAFGGSFGGSANQQPGDFSASSGQSAAKNGQGGFPSMPSGDFTMPEGFEMPEGFDFTGGEQAEDGEDKKDRGGFSFGSFGGFNFGMGSSDVKLSYVDDDPDSYSNIFNNAKTDVSKKDKARLIEALRKLSAGEDLENTGFTDEVIRYLAVHDFLQNSDSYTGMMVHNYYLYEEDGQLAILPWDYNLAFGGMNGSDGTSLVNSPIDTPVANGSASDRPLIGWIFEDEEATAKYHDMYSQFVAEIIESGWLEAEISRVAELIRPYVEADENSFYTAEEFDAAVETLQSYCALRGESIRGQLDGTIPSTSAGQRANSASLVNASSLNISSMGSMNGGGGGGGGFGGNAPGSFSFGGFGGGMTQESAPSASSMPSGGDFGGSTGTQASSGSQANPSAAADNATASVLPDATGMPTGGDFGGSAGTQASSGSQANPSAKAGNATAQTLPDATGMPAGGDFAGSAGAQAPADGQTPPAEAGDATAQPEEGAAEERQSRRGGMSMPDGFSPSGFGGFSQNSSANAMSWWELALYAAILLMAIVLISRAPNHNK